MTLTARVRAWVAAHDGEFTAEQCRAAVGGMPNQIRTALSRLVDDGLVRRLGRTTPRRRMGVLACDRGVTVWRGA